MLIICSGPDTWHARKKAQELVQAFRTKHDPEGLSTEAVRSPIDLKALLNQLGTPSLFSKKRLIRCDGLLDGLKIADVRALAKRLKDDADQTVLLTVEDEPPIAKIIGEFAESKVVQYDSPLLLGARFSTWCVVRGKELGVDEQSAVEIARKTDGDAWRAEQELMKRGAYPVSPLAETDADEGSVFDLADGFLTRRAGWRVSLSRSEETQASTVFVSQARSAIRVSDGEIFGIHPYVVKKLSQLRTASPVRSFLRAIRALVSERQGLGRTDESQTLL